MPAIAHQNKILGNTSGGGSTILVTTSESTLYGQTVTLSDGTTTLSGTFSNTGECEFTGVMMTGNLTLACSGVSQNISIPYFGNYSFVFSLFSATVNVTYPYSEGASCTLSDGTTTLIATGSPMAFTVPNAGTWTASVTLDGVSKTDTATITTDGQVASINIIFGTINVTYDNDFRGLSITCVQSGTTITKTAPSSGNTMYFYPPTTGNWTISGTVSSDTFYSTPNPVVVSSLSTSVSATLETIPDGSTKTPTDDVSIWLSCAGIRDKAYTTLSQVLADSETFNALLGDSNACAYMARSTTFASTLCADQYAMNLVGQYDVCCDALLGNATWASAIVASAYADYVCDVSVPTMTSNTTPSGSCSARGVYDSAHPAYYAFDKLCDSTHYWIDSVADSWIQYTFPSATVCKCMGIVNFANAGIKDYEILASNDNFVSDSHTLKTGTFTQGTSGDYTTWEYISFENDTAYTSYRLHCINNYHPSSLACVIEIQFYGHASSGEYIHGTYSESAYYLDGATQTPIVDPSTLSAGTYTFGSTVAKNPSDLTADYTKTIRITPNTKEIVLRPDCALYWWGYEDSMLEVLSTANGWSWSSTYFGTPTFNNTNVYMTSTSSYDLTGIGAKIPLSLSKGHVIYKGGANSYDGRYGDITESTQKASFNANVILYEKLPNNTLSHGVLESSSNSAYLTTYAFYGQQNTVYALWYE